MTKTDHITKTFQYRLRVNRGFVAACERTLNDARFIYNCALQQRISYYKQSGKSLSIYEQSRQLTEARAEIPEARECLRSIQQDSLERLELAFQAFFRRLKQKGIKAGFPRFKGRDGYNTISQKLEPGRKCPLDGDRLTVPGVGTCRVRLSRPIEGEVKQLRITQRPSGWYALLVCDVLRPEPLPATGLSVGVDVGLIHFATLSDGTRIANPRHLAKAAHRLTQAQRDLSRKKRRGANRVKARQVVARLHERVSNARRDLHHKASYDLVQRFDAIAVESLNVQGMMKNHHLAKAISDVAWGQFFSITQAKAENAGREFHRIDPRYTSQTCSDCGHRQKMPLAVRTFECESCGHVIDRDHNAAINILGRVAPSVEGNGARRNRNKQSKLSTRVPLGPRLFNCA